MLMGGGSGQEGTVNQTPTAPGWRGGAPDPGCPILKAQGGASGERAEGAA